MIEQLVSWVLGPSGLKVLDWYTEHALVVNGVVVVVALVGLAFPRQRDRIAAALRDAWRKTPFALPEEERQLVDEHMARRRAAIYGKKKKEENHESS